MSGRRDGEERVRDNWRNRSISSLYKYLNFKGASVFVGMCWFCCPPPHSTLLVLLLLANHHTTRLYLGHSNVLLLSPLADVLCCNPRKIGWEEKSEESGSKEGVVTEARNFHHYKNWSSSFVIFFFFFPVDCICSSLSLLSPRLYFPLTELWTACFSRIFHRSLISPPSVALFFLVLFIS